MIDTGLRLANYPFALESELRDAANENGYRIAQGAAAGWIFYSSASAPGEIAIAATEHGLAGPLFLSVAHPGAARELIAEPAEPCAKGHAGAFAFPDRASLYEAVSTVYRKSMSLPTLPYEDFVRETEHLGDTENDKLQKYRIGQARFRAALLDYWNSTCPLTGIADPQLLKASHIVSWAQCKTDQHRLDVHNGFLLSSLWDSAFDAGLVTFDDDGWAVPSPAIGEAGRKSLNIESVPPIQLTEPHRRNLEWHRSHIWICNK